MQQLVHKPSHCIATLLTCSISGLLIYSFTFTSTPYTYNPYTHTQALTPTLRPYTYKPITKLASCKIARSITLHSVFTQSFTHPLTHFLTNTYKLKIQFFQNFRPAGQRHESQPARTKCRSAKMEVKLQSLRKGTCA